VPIKPFLRAVILLAADSHLVMIYPLYTLTLEQPENRALVIKSLKHWMGMPQKLAGYSYTGAASISALLEEGDGAAEAGPCIETPLSAAASLNDMLLSSWGDRIRVFPGAPEKWKDITFHNLRAQGAFLVSSSRKNGVTRWVRIKSLAGQPCRIRPGIHGPVKATVPLKPAGEGVYDLELAKNAEAILYSGDTVPDLTITPVAADPALCNYYGLPAAR
jgi:alpha-L-fucosidase 2